MLLKTFLASLAAKIAVGSGLAVATVTAAGAAGVLPEPAQHAVASVVEATTPFDMANQAVGDLQDAVDEVTTTTSSTTSTTVASGDDDAGEDGVTDTARKQNHGACVSTVARNTPGPAKGKTVSAVARSDCGKTSTSTTVAPSTSTTSSTSTTVAGSFTTSSTLDDGARSANSGPGSANRGRGNSGNSGPGNSGKK
jgi:hypothetical protein